MKNCLSKSLCLILSSTMLLSTGTAVFAAGKSNDSEQPQVHAMSPEFPDAYIKVNTSEPNRSIAGIKPDENNKLNPVSITVFVEEDYDYENGQKVVTSSRLLSKQEVDTIGGENFGSKDSVTSQEPRAKLSAGASNSKYKLTIHEYGSYSTPGNGVKAGVTGLAEWSGFDTIYDSEKNPAVGEDFFGFAWSGGFTASNAQAYARWDGDSVATITQADGGASSGRVWAFDEFRNVGGKYMIYVKSVSIQADLSKNYCEGHGNTAEVMCKYIHTYSSTTGTVTVNAGPSGVGAGFSLTSCPKQWSISCFVTGIPY